MSVRYTKEETGQLTSGEENSLTLNGVWINFPEICGSLFDAFNTALGLTWIKLTTCREMRVALCCVLYEHCTVIDETSNYS